MVIFDRLRYKVALWCEQSAPWEETIEIDESYFGPNHIPGKRGRGAGGKTIVFGVFKRQGQVYTEIVSDARKKTLQRVISGEISPESVIHSDGWPSLMGFPRSTFTGKRRRPNSVLIIEILAYKPILLKRLRKDPL